MINWHDISDSKVVGLISPRRLDFATYIEEFGELPIMMYTDVSYLEAWVDLERRKLENSNYREWRLKIYPVGRRSLNDIKHVQGKIRSPAGVILEYDQIWVRASYRHYRAAFRSFHIKRDCIGADVMQSIHADHVINKARLRCHPNAWVVLFPVLSEINSFFGSRVERNCAVLPGDVSSASMDPLPAFKLFAHAFPRNIEELEGEINKIRGWLGANPITRNVVNDFLNKMHAEVLTYIAS